MPRKKLFRWRGMESPCSTADAVSLEKLPVPSSHRNSSAAKALKEAIRGCRVIAEKYRDNAVHAAANRLIPSQAVNRLPISGVVKKPRLNGIAKASVTRAHCRVNTPRNLPSTIEVMLTGAARSKTSAPLRCSSARVRIHNKGLIRSIMMAAGATKRATIKAVTPGASGRLASCA